MRVKNNNGSGVDILGPKLVVSTLTEVKGGVMGGWKRSLQITRDMLNGWR